MSVWRAHYRKDGLPYTVRKNGACRMTPRREFTKSTLRKWLMRPRVEALGKAVLAAEQTAERSRDARRSRSAEASLKGNCSACPVRRRRDGDLIGLGAGDGRLGGQVQCAP